MGRVRPGQVGPRAYGQRDGRRVCELQRRLCPQMTQLARHVAELELSYGSTAVALRIVGRDNPVADAFLRFATTVSGGAPLPDRESRSRFRAQVEARCGRVDVGGMESDDGVQVRGAVYRLPSNSVFDGP